MPFIGYTLVFTGGGGAIEDPTSSCTLQLQSDIIMLQAINLRKDIDGQPMFKDVNFMVTRGEVVALIGASTTGKSALLRCLCRLDTPDLGSLRFHGEEIAGETGTSCSLAWRKPGAAPTDVLSVRPVYSLFGEETLGESVSASVTYGRRGLIFVVR